MFYKNTLGIIKNVVLERIDFIYKYILRKLLFSFYKILFKSKRVF